MSRIKRPIELLHPESLVHLSYKLQHLIHTRLWLKVIVAMAAGFFIGILLNPATGFFEKESSLIIGEWLALPGTVFLALIQMILIPLIFASIIRGIASSESTENLKKSGLFIAGYFIITTLFAVLIGLFLVGAIQPGNYIDAETPADFEVPHAEEISIGLQNIPAMLTQAIPTNLFSAFLNLHFFQIVLFSIIFGVALVKLEVKQSRPLIDLLGSLQDVSITIVQWAMRLVPLAVFGLIARATIQLGLDVIFGMSFYLLTVFIGLLLVLILNLLIIFVFARVNPLDFLRKAKDVLLLAFSVSSSAAVMPVSMEVAEKKFSVRSSIANFVIPMGATMNMNGTALYQTVAVIFLAQVFGIAIAPPTLILIILTIVASSIGAPGTPGASTVILSGILLSAGIPLLGIALILGFDRILDMARTAVNVSGDLSAAIVLEKVLK
jgi:Na+/H+-dicarboxylate symporter